jgi:serine/threonine protein kinase
MAMRETHVGYDERRLHESPPQSFDIVNFIGGGGFGEVLKAVDCGTGRIMAIKRGWRSGVDFVREFEIMSTLNHGNIVRPWWVTPNELGMEWAETSLSALIPHLVANSDRHKLIYYLVSQILSALVAMHEVGIVHADLKPANILVTRRCAVKIADFGNAFVDRPENHPQGYSGTPGYSAPEILAPNPAYSPAVDMWALGCLIFELATGRAPFGAGPQRAMLSEITATCGNRSTFHGWLVRTISEPCHSLIGLIEGLLVLDPGDRLTARQALHWPGIADASPVRGFVVPEAGSSRTRKAQALADVELPQELRPKRVLPKELVA